MKRMCFGYGAPRGQNSIIKLVEHFPYAGCDWVEYEVYSFPGNDFYHLNRECQWLRGNEDRIITYATVGQALLDGKKTYCRKCCPKSD